LCAGLDLRNFKLCASSHSCRLAFPGNDQMHSCTNDKLHKRSPNV
jgi:hypothetical protein